MAANATALMSAISAELIAAFPTLDNCPTRVYLSKRQVAGGKPPLGGWIAGFQPPAFVLSMNDEEIIDKYGTFELISVTYGLLVEYCKQTQAKVTSKEYPPNFNPNSVADGPAIGREDPQVRDVKQAIRQAIYKPSAPYQTGQDLTQNMVDVELRSKRTYEVDGSQSVIAVGMTFWFTLWEPRPEE